MPWCTGCDRFLSPSTVTAAGACPRCGATVDPGRARPPDPAASVSEPASDAVTPAAPPEVAVTGAPVAAVPVEAAGAGSGADDETPLPIPWHFKLLVGAIALYLGWRAFQGIDWLVGRF